MKTILLFITGVCINLVGMAQSPFPGTLTAVTPTTNWACGSQQVNSVTASAVSSQIATFRGNQPVYPAATSFVIPVVVHVLYDAAHAADPSFNISYRQIQWQISALNMSFQNTGSSSMPRATNSQIQFCLAQTPMGPNWTNSGEPGVMRYQVATSVLSHTIDLPGKNQLLGITHTSAANFPFENYLNIWLVNDVVDTTGVYTGTITPNSNVIGYANFPNSLSLTNPLDGIVIRHDVFGSRLIPNNQNLLMAQLDQGRILAHEAGHYLSMLHTFTDGCVGTTGADCATQGDLICDTPPTTILNTNNCGASVSTCVDALPIYGGVNQNDMLQNIMCYADDNCLEAFTADQCGVMQGVLNTAWPGGRQDMTTATNLSNTGLTSVLNCCPGGVTTAFFTSTITSCTSVDFQCAVPPCALNNSYAWNFGDGNTLTTASNTVSHTYAGSGLYTPTLTVTNTLGGTDVYYKPIQLGTYAQSSAKKICNNTSQGVYFHVTGASGTYSLLANFNGNTATHTYSIDPYLQAEYGHPGSEDIEFHLPVNLPQSSLPAQIIYTVTLSGTDICPVVYIDTFFVSECCPSVIKNGNFSNGYNDFTRNNTGIVGNFSWLYWPFVPSLKFDSPVCGLPSTCTAIEMYNTQFPLIAGHDYHMNFQCFGGNSSSRILNGNLFLMDTLFLNARILDNSGNVLQDFGTFPVMDLVDSTWHHYDFLYPNPAYTGNAHLSISQVKNFYSLEAILHYNNWNWYGWGYDYAIDEVSMRPVSLGFVTTVTPGFVDVCPGQSTTLIASGASTYTWSTGAHTTTVSVSPTAGTIYSVTGTSTLGCTYVAQASVNVLPSPSLTITVSPTVICPGQTSTLSVAGASTYSWSTGALSSSITVSPGVTTIYTVTGTSSMGCTSTATVELLIGTPVLTVSPSHTTICRGQTITATASGAATYTWNTGATTATISGAPASSAIFTVTGASASGCTATATASVTVNLPPSLSLSPTSVTLCSGASQLLTASGTSASYLWSTGATGTSISVSPTVTTVYTVTGTSAAGCTIATQATVTVPALSINPNSLFICVSGSATLSATGAGSYTWSPGGAGNNLVVSPTVTTTYTVSSVVSGCTLSALATVTVSGPPTATVSSNVSTVCGGSALFSGSTNATDISWGWEVWNSAMTSTLSAAISGSATASPTVNFSGIYQNSSVCATITNTLYGCSSVSCATVLACCQTPTSTTVYANTTFTASAMLGGGGPAQHYRFSGLITVSSGTLELANLDITMDPYTEILVENGATLSVRECYMHGCNAMWKGISGYGNARIEIGGSVITDAAEAVLDSIGGTDLLIHANYFNKNYVSILLRGPANSTDIFQNLFTCSAVPGPTVQPYLGPTPTLTLAPYLYSYGVANLLPPYQNQKSYAGISLFNTTSAFAPSAAMVIGSPNNGEENIFDKLQVGIAIVRSNALLQNNVFQNMKSSTNPGTINAGVYVYSFQPGFLSGMWPACNVQVGGSSALRNTFIDNDRGVQSVYKNTLSIANNTFSTQTTGIVMNQNYNNLQVDIGTNKFTDCQTGVECYNNPRTQVNVTNNRFENIGAAIGTYQNNYGIRCTEPTLSTNPSSYPYYHIFNNAIDGYYNGIHVNHTYNSQIYDNEVYMRYDNTSGHYCNGIYNGYGNSVTIDNNIVQHSTYDANTTGWWHSAILCDWTALPVVKCNLMDGIGTSLLIKGPCYTTAGNGIYMNEMKNGIYGTWLDNSAEIGNQYYTAASTNYSADNQWSGFSAYQTYVTGNSNLTTTSSTSGQSRFSTRGSSPYSITTFSPTVSTFGVGNPLIGTLVSNTAISCATHSTTTARMASIGPDTKLMQLGNEIAADSVSYADYADNLRLVNRRSLLRNIKLQQLQTNENEALDHFMKQVAYENTAYFYSIDSLLTTADSIDYGGIEVLNSSIVSANITELAQQEVNSIHLHYLANKGVLSSNDVSALEAMAQQCPLEYGPAVNKARVMVYEFTHQTYSNACERNNPNRNHARLAGSTETGRAELRVYPNPANTELWIELAAYETVSLKLYNIIGELVMEKQLQENVAIDVKELVTGSYLYQVFSNHVPVKSGKLIIAR